MMIKLRYTITFNKAKIFGRYYQDVQLFVFGKKGHTLCQTFCSLLNAIDKKLVNKGNGWDLPTDENTNGLGVLPLGHSWICVV